jgi:hypothetical protein
MFPALERVLVLTSAGPLILLDGDQTPQRFGAWASLA